MQADISQNMTVTTENIMLKVYTQTAGIADDDFTNQAVSR